MDHNLLARNDSHLHEPTVPSAGADGRNADSCTLSIHEQRRSFGVALARSLVRPRAVEVVGVPVLPEPAYEPAPADQVIANLVRAAGADAPLRLELVQVLTDERGVVLVVDARLLVASEGVRDVFGALAAVVAIELRRGASTPCWEPDRCAEIRPVFRLARTESNLRTGCCYGDSNPSRRRERPT